MSGNQRERVYFSLPISKKDEPLPEKIKNKYFPEVTEDKTWMDLQPLLLSSFGYITFKQMRRIDSHEKVILIEMDSLSILNGEFNEIKKLSLEEKDLNLNVNAIWVQIVSTSAIMSKEEIQICFPNAPKNIIQTVLAEGLTWEQVAVQYNLTYYTTGGIYIVKVPDMLDNIVAEMLTNDDEVLSNIYTTAEEASKYLEEIPVN